MKEILLLWFGDMIPAYAEWNVENFRKMNPGWSINFKRYTNSQIFDYRNVNDEFLTKAVIGTAKAVAKDLEKIDCVLKDKPDAYIDKYNTNYIADMYRYAYINKAVEHNKKNFNDMQYCIYCDLDCFPIAPFDDFIPKVKDITVFSDIYNKIEYRTKYAGMRFSKKLKREVFDIWIMKSFHTTVNQFVQMQEDIDLHANTINLESGWVVNEGYESVFKERKDKFEKCELSSHWCSPKLSPVEHYYCRSRFKYKDKNQIADFVKTEVTGL